MENPITLAPVRLLKLEIERERWGPAKDQYKGSITFDGPNGAIQLALPPELSLEYLRVSSDILSKVSAQAAANLRGDIMASLQHAAPVALPPAAQ